MVEYLELFSKSPRRNHFHPLDYPVPTLGLQATPAMFYQSDPSCQLQDLFVTLGDNLPAIHRSSLVVNPVFHRLRLRESRVVEDSFLLPRGEKLDLIQQQKFHTFERKSKMHNNSRVNSD